ncbi:LuxR C-terminal-related transcriptional regulator [Leucobacter sp. GX24907]
MGDPAPPFTAPRLAPGHIRRERLVERLDAVAEASLIFVHAPAGGGKTNLVAGWVRERAPYEPCIWVSFGERGSTPERFWSEVTTAVEQFTARPSLSQDDLAAVLNRHGQQFTLVIDDAHHADAELREDMFRLVRELHIGRVMALTRTLDATALSALRLQVHTAVITAQDLAFTRTEALELVTARAARQEPVPNGTDFPIIFEASGGHPLLLRHLLSVPYSRSEELAQRATDAWAAALLSSEAKSTSLELVLAPRVDAELARRITGVSEPAAVLAVLASDALGEVDADGFFHFYPAVRSAVHYRARQDVPASRRQEIRELAADYLHEVTGDTDAMLSILAENGRYEDMWQLFAARLSDQALRLEAHADDSPLAATLGASDEAATVAAVVQSAHAPFPSIGLLRLVDQALEDLQQRPPLDDPEDAVYREVAIHALLWAANRFEEGAGRTGSLLQLTERLSPSSRSGVWSAAYWGLLYSAVMLALSGELHESERVLRLLSSDLDDERSSQRAVQQAFIHAMRGEVVEAARFLASDPTSGRVSPEWAAKLTVARAAVQLESGQPEDALATLTELEPELGSVREWPYYLIVLARTHIARDPRVGLEELNRLVGVHGERTASKKLLDMLHATRADLALAAGELGQAKRIVAGRTRNDPAQRLTAARIALFAPDASVVADLRDLIDENQIWRRGRAMAFFLLSVHAHRQGDDNQAGEALRSALAITGSHGIRLIMSLIPRSELSEIATAAGVELPPNVNVANPLDEFLAPVMLTPREQVLIELLKSPLRLKDIAEKEFVTLHTVKSQVTSIYRKLGVRSRTAAVHEASRRGLIES